VVKIRLMRTGKKKRASYRVVVANATSPRDGRIIESIGHYQPRADPSVIVIDNDRAVYWLQQGAQPSPPVRKLLDISGAWGEFSGRPGVTASAGSSEAAAAPMGARRATPAASVAEADEEGPLAE
jgi:small subunit ribosomal protein S16